MEKLFSKIMKPSQVRYFVVWLVVVIGSAILAWNILHLCARLRVKFIEGFENLGEGRAFVDINSFDSSRVRPATERIAPGSTCFYWSEEAMEEEYDIATECRAIEFNYYLWSSKIFYVDDRRMLKSDYVLCDGWAERELRLRLVEIELATGSSMDFDCVHQEHSTVIFKRRKK